MPREWAPGCTSSAPRFRPTIRTSRPSPTIAWPPSPARRWPRRSTRRRPCWCSPASPTCRRRRPAATPFPATTSASATRSSATRAWNSGPTPRFIGCQRGALGTKAAPHAAGGGGQGPAHDVGLLPRRSRQHAGRRTHHQFRRGVQRVRLRHGLLRRQRRHQRRLPRPLVLPQQAAPGLLPQVQEGRALPDQQRHGQRPGLAHRPPQCLGRRPRRPEEVPRRAAAGDAGHGRELHASRRRLVLHVCRRPARPDRIRLRQDDRPGRFDFHRDLAGDDGPARPRPADDRDGRAATSSAGWPSPFPRACASSFASRARISSSFATRRQRLEALPRRLRGAALRGSARRHSRTCGRSGTTSRPPARWASRSRAARAMSRRATTTRPAP